MILFLQSKNIEVKVDIFLQTASALNDETRVKIIKFLNINGACCVCDLENSFIF